MIDVLRSLCLIIAAIIHILPLSGLLGSAKLNKLYGLNFAEPNLLILMQHRAVLFGLLGSFLLAAAFRPQWQAAAVVIGLVSAVSFMLIAYGVGNYNNEIRRVVVADWVAVAALLVAGFSLLVTQHSGQ